MSQIQSGFAKMFKWHQNLLNSENFKLILEKLQSSNSNSTLICGNQKCFNFILLQFEKSINALILSVILFENAKKILIVQVCTQGWRGLQKRRIASHKVEKRINESYDS